MGITYGNQMIGIGHKQKLTKYLQNLTTGLEYNLKFYAHTRYGNTIDTKLQILLDTIWRLDNVRQPTYSFDFRTNNNTGRINDQLGTGLGVTFLNGVTFTEANGAFFSGGNDSTAPYASIDQFSLQTTITVELYFKINSPSDWLRIFSFGDAGHGSGSNNFHLARRGSNNYLGVYTNNSGWGYSSSYNQINFGTYMHIVVTATPSGGKIYTNNVEYIYSTASDLVLPGTRNYNWLGRSLWENDSTDMNMLYFRIWNGIELNSTEVGELYQNFNTSAVNSTTIFDRSISNGVGNTTQYEISFIPISTNQYLSFYESTDTSNIIWIDNVELYTGLINLPDTNFNITYRGTKVKKLAKVRIETTDNLKLGLEELQLWSENNNVIAHYDPDKPTNTFILTDSTRSLTDIYSSNSLTLVGNPGFDNDGVHLIGSQYITIPQSILGFGSDDFTISLWTQTSVASGTPHILSMGYNNTNSWLLGSDGNVIQLYGYQQTSTGDGDTDVNFTVDNQATNYIISRVGNKMKLFINGVLKLDLDISVSLPAQDYHIGYSLSYGSYYSGAIKRLDIWKGTGFSS